MLTSYTNRVYAVNAVYEVLMDTMLMPACTIPDMPKRNMPESEKKVAAGARFKPAVLAALQALADADQRTLSFMIEKAVNEYVEKNASPSKRDKLRPK